MKRKSKDLNKLSKEIYEANKDKGFHEERRSQEHLLCLVISELMEAVEADRKGMHADLKSFEQFMSGVKDKHYNKMFAECFKQLIKDSISDELADAVIRILDMVGALQLEISNKSIEDADDFAKRVSYSRRSFTECVFDIVSSLSSYQAHIALTKIVVLCDLMSIDLWKHVELKLKYNSLRPHKHGKLY